MSNKVIIRKENNVVSVGEIETKELTELKTNVNKEKKHLCWQDCANASPLKCPKVYDKIKKNIADYDFISDGFQVLEDDGDMDAFCVLGCKKYEREVFEELSPEEARKIRKSVKMSYFDAESIDEANKIQAEQFRSGTIQHFESYNPFLTREELEKARESQGKNKKN